jgi:hypothetical protein
MAQFKTKQDIDTWYDNAMKDIGHAKELFETIKDFNYAIQMHVISLSERALFNLKIELCSKLNIATDYRSWPQYDEHSKPIREYHGPRDPSVLRGGGRDISE